MRTAIACLSLILIAGCSSAVTPPDAPAVTTAASVSAAPQKPAPIQAADTQASLACDHFRNIVVDITKGILTPAEIRDKMKEVNGDASIAPADVQSAATNMLAASTQDDGSAFLTAVTAMGKACTAAGS